MSTSPITDPTADQTPAADPFVEHGSASQLDAARGKGPGEEVEPQPPSAPSRPAPTHPAGARTRGLVLTRRGGVALAALAVLAGVAVGLAIPSGVGLAFGLLSTAVVLGAALSGPTPGGRR